MNGRRAHVWPNLSILNVYVYNFLSLKLQLYVVPVRGEQVRVHKVRVASKYEYTKYEYFVRSSTGISNNALEPTAVVSTVHDERCANNGDTSATLAHAIYTSYDSNYPPTHVGAHPPTYSVPIDYFEYGTYSKSTAVGSRALHKQAADIGRRVRV